MRFKVIKDPLKEMKEIWDIDQNKWYKIKNGNFTDESGHIWNLKVFSGSDEKDALFSCFRSDIADGVEFEFDYELEPTVLSISQSINDLFLNNYNDCEKIETTDTFSNAMFKIKNNLEKVVEKKRFKIKDGDSFRVKVVANNEEYLVESKYSDEFEDYIMVIIWEKSTGHAGTGCTLTYDAESIEEYINDGDWVIID
jgi:hypothetical protein